MSDDWRPDGETGFTVEEPEADQKSVSRRVNRLGQSRFLGMTAAQRFVIVVMLLMMTCLLGTFCLLVTQRVVPPFLY